MNDFIAPQRSVRLSPGDAISMQPAWLLLAIILSLLVLVPLVHQSMFFDGVIYSSIARNMSEDVGSLWNPHFSDTLYPLFSEHPPLMMWLESIAFRVFGDTILVEKGFSLLTLVTSGWILLALWRLLNEGDPQFQRAGAIPLILALVAGRVGWAFSNNMLENPLIVFTSLAIYLVANAYSVSGNAGILRKNLLVLGAGVATGLALLTKGPVGLFPIAAPGLYWLVFRRPTLATVVADTLVIIAVTAFSLAVMWQFVEPRAYIERYLTLQLLSSLHGERGATSGGLHALRTLLRVSSYPVLLTIVLVLSARFLTPNTSEAADGDLSLRRSRSRRGIFLLLVGLSASIPLLVSPRISSFYFNPSLLYFASALAIWCVLPVRRVFACLDERRRQRLIILLLSALTIALSIVAAGVTSLGADRAKIEDAAKIVHYICLNATECRKTVAACNAVWQDSQLHAYLQRYYEVSLGGAADTPSEYLIGNRDCMPKPSDGYTEVDIGLSGLSLLRR